MLLKPIQYTKDIVSYARTTSTKTRKDENCVTLCGWIGIDGSDLQVDKKRQPSYEGINIASYYP